jgi:hypothetical protein
LKVWGNATFSKLSQTPVSNRIKKDWKYFWRKHLNGGRRPRNNWKPSWRWGGGAKNRKWNLSHHFNHHLKKPSTKLSKFVEDTGQL